MKDSLLVGIAIIVLAGCSPEPPPTATSPSPPLTADADHLWILLRASRVGDGRECAEHYLKPNDPRYRGLAQKCDIWTHHIADYLTLNGFPTIEHQHLKEPSYWQWYLDKRQHIANCVKTIGNLSIIATSTERADHTQRRRACDPYDDALYNNRRWVTNDLGIRYP